MADERVVDFHTLWVAAEWIRAHCVVPDGHSAGAPYEPADWQAWFLLNHYRVRPDAPLPTVERPAIGAPAFHYRRSQIVTPQKSGKGPLSAAQVALEAVGPALFAGWARDGDYYDCADHGCPCGWGYDYDPGEPMGTPWPTPLIQLTAYSVEQAANVYDAFREMVKLGPLGEIVEKPAEDFARLPNGGRIDRVTSSQQSRLGQRVTFCVQDEVGIWLVQNKMDKVATTQRRGAAGMQGRTVETTNAWNPTENSVAQKTYEASLRVDDIFRYHPQAPAHLSFGAKAERLRILREVYEGCWWIDLGSINAEAEEIMLEDPGQAERFYGNRVKAGMGQWIVDDLWDSAFDGREVAPGTPVAVGFDGSDSDDWTAIRCETIDGHRFTPTYGPDDRPTYWNPKEWGGSIPRDEVNAAVDAIASKYVMRRLYADPRDWQTEIGDWSLKYGDTVVFEWATYRIAPMHLALVQSFNDYKNGLSTHDGCRITREHVLNARKAAKPSDRYILVKQSQSAKIDLAMADTLAHLAAFDLRVKQQWVEEPKPKLTRVKGKARSQ